MRNDEFDGRTVLAQCSSEPPLSVQRTLYCEHDAPEMAYVYISSTSGGMLQGDRHVMIIDAGPNTATHITTQGATRIHGDPRMPHQCVRQHVKMTLEKGAYLEYMPDQIIPYAHSSFVQDAVISAHETSTLVYSEIISQGRAGMGESFEYRLLESKMCITDIDNDKTLKFVDASRITPRKRQKGTGATISQNDSRPSHDIKSFGIMSKYDVIASLYIITEKRHVQGIQKNADKIILSDGKDTVGGAVAMRNNVGVLARILGPDTESLKRVINKVAAYTRKTVLNAPFTDIRKS